MLEFHTRGKEVSKTFLKHFGIDASMNGVLKEFEDFEGQVSKDRSGDISLIIANSSVKNMSMSSCWVQLQCPAVLSSISAYLQS